MSVCLSVDQRIKNCHKVSFIARTNLLSKLTPHKLINVLLAGPVQLKNSFVRTVPAKKWKNLSSDFNYSFCLLHTHACSFYGLFSGNRIQCTHNNDCERNEICSKKRCVEGKQKKNIKQIRCHYIKTQNSQRNPSYSIFRSFNYMKDNTWIIVLPSSAIALT